MSSLKYQCPPFCFLLPPTEKLKAAEKKRAEKKKRDLAFAKSASGGPKFSSDNQVGGDGRGG